MGTVILTLVIFLMMILIHECGHFFAARACGVKINEFAIGMGPKLFKKQGKETLYTIRLLPIGGYVSMEGEDETSEDPRAFYHQKPWKRSVILCAGAAMNLLLGLILMLGVYGTRDTVPTTTVAQFAEDAVSSQSGLQVGDDIVSINGTHIFTDVDVVTALLDHDSATMQMEVRRDGELVRLDAVEFHSVTEEGQTPQLYIDFYLEAVPNDVFKTFAYSVENSISLTRMVWFAVLDLFTGQVGFDQLSGPIGVGQAVGQAAQYGVASVLLLSALLSINLGVFNLLPLPALDGGRLVFVIIEMVIRRPFPRKYEGWIHMGGMVILLGLMVVIAVNDIYKLF